MPKTSTNPKVVRTGAIVRPVCLFVLAALLACFVSCNYISCRDEQTKPDIDQERSKKAALLLAEQTHSLLERAPLDRSGQIIHSEEKGDFCSLTWEGSSETDLIVAEKVIVDFWRGLGNLDVKIEYPDHAKRGERIRLFASTGDRMLMAVSLARKEAPKSTQTPTAAKPPAPQPTPSPKKKKDPFPAPGPGTGKIVIIIDDIGFNMAALDKLLRINVPLTYSVLPNAPEALRAVEKIHSHGGEVMLHMPMEPLSYPQTDPGQGALLVGMTQAEVRKRVLAGLKSVPGAKGVNNHMGSAYTANSEGMEKLLVVLKEQDLFFVDSRTTIDTVAYKTASFMGVPCAKRDVFLDHYITFKNIKNSLVKLSRKAGRQTTAVAICHPHPETIRVLSRYLPEMEKKGHRFAYASEAVK